jgi:hypothetical protein
MRFLLYLELLWVIIARRSVPDNTQEDWSMNILRSLLALVLLSFCSAPATATDLSKVDRTIKKEPAYKNKPKYCLLVFGLEAKTRVWLVLDGDVLHVDRNGNGDLTEDGKRVLMPAFQESQNPFLHPWREVKAGDVTDGRLTHTDLLIMQTHVRSFVAQSKEEAEIKRQTDEILRQTAEGIVYGVGLKVELASPPGERGSTQRVHQGAFAENRQGHLVFADRPQDAPVIHFGGPLTMYLYPDQKLTRGEPSSEPKTSIGTPGLGKGTFAIAAYDHVPNDTHPVAKVEFPPKTLGKEPITMEVPLTKRC